MTGAPSPSMPELAMAMGIAGFIFGLVYFAAVAANRGSSGSAKTWPLPLWRSCRAAWQRRPIPVAGEAAPGLAVQRLPRIFACPCSCLAHGGQDGLMQASPAHQHRSASSGWRPTTRPVVTTWASCSLDCGLLACDPPP